MIFVQCRLWTSSQLQRRGFHTLHENRTIQNKLTTRSVPDPPVRAGDEKHTSSAAGPETTGLPLPYYNVGGKEKKTPSPPPLVAVMREEKKKIIFFPLGTRL